MSTVASVKVQYPGSMFVHVFSLRSDGRVYRTTVGVEVPTDCGTFPELKTKEDLLRKVSAQGYEEVPGS